ncbi:MAG: histidinol dehydrogenase [Sediminibacterium sp.]|nr:histidinol dehydrogenase [Sediminibacterium sp.]
MKVFINPSKAEWPSILARPVMNIQQALEKVRPILKDVQSRGDEALREWTKKLDGVDLNELAVSTNEVDLAANHLSNELKQAIQTAANNIEKFHAHQLSEPVVIETMPGIRCWRKSIAMESVGIYIPGGSAPLFSTVLMLGIPAKLAGCKEVVLCSPPNSEGQLHPAILYAAQLVGVTKIFKVGGAQAIAAMAYGTESIPSVVKIFGPGNQYVTAAKQWVQSEGIAIDMPAGPSEVCVWADETAIPDFVAADLLSQAEHGPDSQVLLITTDSNFPNKVQSSIQEQLKKLSRASIANAALDNSRIVVVEDNYTALAMVNAYAAEHLIIATKQALQDSEMVTNAGSIFIGHYSPESAGDYASGTNHTLPTNGYAKAYSGVSVDSFVKKVTFQELTKEGIIGLSDTVEAMANAEGLQAHAYAVTVRVEHIKNNN